MSVALFATYYFPTVEYFLLLARFNKINIEAHEHFPKQTNRNRTHVLSSNGVQTLSIPLIQTHQKIFTGAVEIDLNTNWKIQHWRSITIAYNRSAFFEFYCDKIEEVFFKEEKSLLVFNTEIIKLLIELFKLKAEINFSESYQRETENDFRFISDKKNTTPTLETNFKKYPQVFSTKFDFAKNLSIIDLLFNSGNQLNDFNKTTAKSQL
jgi:hypothetical protein